ncbi:transcriptional regulator [Staphylococcus haemolyticus]|uniref:transcriptional activator RinB n=1 Tax=Staphylococcus haemolyticus TaxID=1283 RepID=UPI000D1DC930|nr:transcriptional regulator [Staphylococcus haemolyticus]PTK77173.1 transcriptional regulator [Staphylococcus haemolyticus]
MIKRILKIWFIIGVYELSKYLTNELIVKLQSEDDVEVPQDFTQDDHIHLNAEVSE